MISAPQMIYAPRKRYIIEELFALWYNSFRNLTFQGGPAMLLYAIILFLSGALVAGLGLAIYRGKTDLIHSYHQTKVTDPAAYGKAFGKAMFVIAAALILSGLIGLMDNTSLLAVAVLMVGLAVGICCIIAVQHRYNKGIF